MTCDRCGAETISTTMSWFNTETICQDCDLIEREHPDFEEARSVETHFVQIQMAAGANINYDGIGLPDGYHEWAAKQDVEQIKSRLGFGT